MFKEMFEEQMRFDEELQVHQSVAQRQPQAVICGLGSAFPARAFSQKEVQARLGINNKTVHKLLSAGHIQTRHLYLPDPPAGESAIADESQEALNHKFDEGVLDIGLRAAERALADSPLDHSDIEFLICVTSSGFRVPGVSSVLARALNLKPSLYRLDVVGMGCNAGMSALQTAAALSRTGLKGLLVCCEINSAIYVRDESVRTGIVNSLFGDGAVAAVIADTLPASPHAGVGSQRTSLQLLEFASLTLPEEWQAMKFDWNSQQGKWSFGLSKQIPFVVGENLKHPVRMAIKKSGLKRSQIKHWSIHTGGAAVIEGAKRSLRLDEEDVRHTRSVLRDYGNISSGSFLVSLERLLQENVVQDGDYGMLAAMGPGASLEACAVKFAKT